MSRKIKTFNDLSDNNGNDEGNDSEGESSRPQDFYVGSGQQVQGPPGSGRRPNDVFGQVMNAARANGADALSADDMAAQQPGDVVRVNMYMWSNGFSIDNGPLRTLEDPASQEFLRAIMQGRVPAEIEQLHRGRKIDFHLEKKGCEYTPPKAKPFEGAGVRLGNVVPSVVGESSSAAPVVPETSADEAAKNLENAKKELALDSAQPTTNLQIRLLNNQRLVGTFNQSHTVSAVRNYICTAHPELLYQPFVIATTYPRKDVDDETLTLKDANLLNAALALRQA